METAIWLIKYGARTAATEEINENDAKIVHKCFKQAAGVFEQGLCLILAITLKISRISTEHIEPNDCLDSKLQNDLYAVPESTLF